MLGRLLAIKIVASILLLTGCASAPHAAPRFVAPSMEPVRKAIAVAQSSVKTAQTHANNARQDLRAVESAVLSGDNANLKIELTSALGEIDALSDELTNTQAALANAEGANTQLQTELVTQVDQANKLASDYDKSSAQITSLKESRHGWVKRFWIATAAAAGCLIWIFRKPILLLVGL